MAVKFSTGESNLRESRPTIFLSSSIPDKNRWKGTFDPLEITDAVVALARASLSRGFNIVTAAHPTIAPLLLFIADELPSVRSHRISIYQSKLFETVLPSATRRFEEEGIGSIRWTPAVQGESPIPGNWSQSLQLMRTQMFSETLPTAAFFIGGMDGIRTEFELYGQVRPNHPRYALASTGGVSATLENSHSPGLNYLLKTSSVYSRVWTVALDDLENRFYRNDRLS